MNFKIKKKRFEENNNRIPDLAPEPNGNFQSCHAAITTYLLLSATGGLDKYVYSPYDTVFKTLVLSRIALGILLYPCRYSRFILKMRLVLVKKR